MSNITLRHILIATTGIAAGILAVLWSFNTLAGLLGMPQAEWRHAVAFLLAAFVIRSFVTRRRRPWHT